MTRNKLSLKSNQGRYLGLALRSRSLPRRRWHLLPTSTRSSNSNWMDWIAHTGKVIEVWTRPGQIHSLRWPHYKPISRPQIGKAWTTLRWVFPNFSARPQRCARLTLDNASQQRRLDQIDQSVRRAANLAHDVIQRASTMTPPGSYRVRRSSPSSASRCTNSARNSTPCPRPKEIC